MAKGEGPEVISVPEVDTMNELDIAQWYRDGSDTEPVDPAEIQREIVLRILSATTQEAIMQPVTTTVAEEVLGVPLLIRGYRRMPSTKADSALKYYMLIDAVDPFGETMNVTCGSINVMARLVALKANGFLPIIGAIVQSAKATASGYFPMDIEPRTAEDATKYAEQKAKDF